MVEDVNTSYSDYRHIMKLLSVELPVCGTQVFEKFYEQNFKKLSILKDIIIVNINFQNVPQDKICEYITYIESLGIEVRYIISDYAKGSSIIDLREKHIIFATNVHSL